MSGRAPKGYTLSISKRDCRDGKSKIYITPPQKLTRMYPPSNEANFWFGFEEREIYYPIVINDNQGKVITLPKDSGVEVRMTITASGNGPDTEPAQIQTTATKGVYWFKAIKAYIFGTIHLSFTIIDNKKYVKGDKQISLTYVIKSSVDEHGNQAPDLSSLTDLSSGHYYDYVYEKDDDYVSSEDEDGRRTGRRGRSTRQNDEYAFHVMSDISEEYHRVPSKAAPTLIANINSKDIIVSKYDLNTLYDKEQLWGPRRSYGNTRTRLLVASEEDDNIGAMYYDEDEGEPSRSASRRKVIRKSTNHHDFEYSGEDGDLNQASSTELIDQDMEDQLQALKSESDRVPMSSSREELMTSSTGEEEEQRQNFDQAVPFTDDSTNMEMATNAIKPRFRSYSRDPRDSDGSTENHRDASIREIREIDLDDIAQGNGLNHMLLQPEQGAKRSDSPPRMKATDNSTLKRARNQRSHNYNYDASNKLQQQQQHIQNQLYQQQKRNQKQKTRIRDVDDMIVVEPLLSTEDAFSRIQKVLNVRMSMEDTKTALDVTSMLDEYIVQLSGGSAPKGRGRPPTIRASSSNPNAHIHRGLAARATQLRGLLEAKHSIDIALQSFLKLQ